MEQITCIDSSTANFLFFNTNLAPALLYYSYIPIAILSLFIGLYVLIKGDQPLLKRIFFLIFFNFFLIILNEIVTWIAIPVEALYFSWQMVILLEVVMYFLYFYLIYVFVYKHDLPFWNKVIMFLIFMPVIALLPTKYNISTFDLRWCNGEYGSLIFYNYFFQFVTIVLILNFYFRKKKGVQDVDQKKTRIMLVGSLIFLIIYTFLAIFSDLTLFYEVNLLGPLSKLLFLVFLSVMIVKYRTFNLKIYAPQLFIFFLIFLNFSLLFIEEMSQIRIIVYFTVAVSVVVGWYLIRSVKLVARQKEMLELANQEQETLVHFITHQIKGFFTKSRNIFDTLTDMENVPEGAQRLITEGLRSDKEGVELVENILNAANMKTGKMKFDNKEIDLDAIVKKVISETNDTVTAKKLKLNYYCSTAPVKFMGDEFRLRDVFKNLIQNSINYTFEGGVTIYLNKKPDHIEFIVQDTGVGLTEDDKKKLFTSGGRGVESVKYNVSSTGYGLFIVKKVIDNYNGRIWAESEGRNKGSKFTLILPF